MYLCTCGVCQICESNRNHQAATPAALYGHPTDRRAKCQPGLYDSMIDLNIHWYDELLLLVQGVWEEES